MESEGDFTPDDDEEHVAADLPALTEDENAAKSKKKKKKKKKKKSKRVKVPKEMVMNDKGEIVPIKEYLLDKTLTATTKSLNACQTRLETIVEENQDLQDTLQDQEMDALQVIAALHQESEKKDVKMKELEMRIKQVEEDAEDAKNKVKQEYAIKEEEMMAILAEKESASKIMQQEFAVIKDFRRKRHDLLKELEDAKSEIVETEKRHREIITRLEKKFFEEKIRLQKEANQKIGELASKAHKEAVINLKNTTKDVFKENIKMSEALLYHVQDGEELKHTNVELTDQIRQLLHEKEMHSVIVKEKIVHSKAQEAEILQLKDKVQHMEHSLTYVVQEFENERSLIGNVARSELEQVRKVVDDLSTKLRTKTIEMRHIKRLAQHVLDQRTELELFFMESLEYVKQQIRQKRLGELRTNQENYKKSMKDVLKSRKVIPPLKSINPIKNSSLPTSLVIEPEEDSIPKKEKIDIQDLEWTDKEKILRVLFAKMNGISLTNEVEKRKPLIDELDRAHKHRSGFSDIVPSDSFSKKSYSRPGTSKSMQLSVVSELVSTVPPSTAGMNAEPEALSGSGFQPLTT